LCYSAGKKSGKTAMAAFIVIYTALYLSPLRGEIYLLANDLEQSTSRVFRAVGAILAASPLLCRSATITQNKIVFNATGTTVVAVANDYRGFSGANPVLNVYDESAYFTSEASQRLWSEGVPSPARQISFRLSVSTAGFEGEPSPLREIYDRAMTYGVEVAPELRVDRNLLCFWSNRTGLAPWQSQQWTDEMARTLRPAQYQRLIENRWSASQTTFVELSEWDACCDPDVLPLSYDKRLRVWAGLDLGLRHDATALVVVTVDKDRVVLVDHKTFIPGKGETLDIEATAEQALRDLARRFDLNAVAYDSWQAIDLGQRLKRAHLNMVEVTQTASNQGPMANQLIDLIKQRRLSMYPASDLRLAVSKTVIIESSRGYRLGKTKGSDRVDPIIALSMAVLIAGKREGIGPSRYYDFFGSGKEIDPSIFSDDGIPRGDILAPIRPPADFKPLAKTESQTDPDPLAPRNPGTLWDYIITNKLEAADPITVQGYEQALTRYQQALAERRAKRIELVRA
jgi:phage terminase large subunit-like protein